MTSSRYPLEGILVLDLGQVYQGPYVGFLLAMAGAHVIKIEPPQGESIRFRADSQGETSLPLAILNSNKLGITLNLKSDSGKEIFLRLSDKADVVLENFAPGVMQRLGLGAEALRERNSQLIYASASGYGTSGPYRNYQAMDLTIQAMSGMMSITGFEDGPPVKCGAAVCDFLGGAHLFAAIVTALFRRERTGEGSTVETAMLDTAYPALASSLGLMYDLDGPPPRTGNNHGGKTMGPYNVYPTRDGFVSIICVKDDHWRKLAAVIGRPELGSDPHYATHAVRMPRIGEIDRLISDWTRQRSKEEIFRLASEYRFPAAPVRDLCEVTADPHLHQRGMLKTVRHPELGEIVLPNSPVRFADLESMPLRFNPKLGEHNEEVSRTLLNLSDEEFEDFSSRGAFG